MVSMKRRVGKLTADWVGLINGYDGREESAPAGEFSLIYAI